MYTACRFRHWNCDEGESNKWTLESSYSNTEQDQAVQVDGSLLSGPIEPASPSWLVWLCVSLCVSACLSVWDRERDRERQEMRGMDYYSAGSRGRCLFPIARLAYLAAAPSDALGQPFGCCECQTMCDTHPRRLPRERRERRIPHVDCSSQNGDDHFIYWS